MIQPFLTSCFPLATTAIKRASISLDNSADRQPAQGAFLSRFLKYHQMVLIFAGIPIRVHKIRKTGPATPDRVPHDCAYGIRQSCRFAVCDGEASALRVDPRKEEGFACIDISEPGNFPLIQEKGLNFLPAFFQS